MQNYYQFLIPRLNGDLIKEEFKKHRSLVRKGIAGFIVFGGRLNQVRKHIKNLQEEARLPLIISSDLERGLGQQLTGGTLFPPAMAIAQAIKQGTRGKRQGTLSSSNIKNISPIDLKLLRQAFRAVAEEARYAGINTIFAPVLDINTNPDNPIISVRAFGEDRDTVAFFGSEMIKTFQEAGIAACGKHFPGHGDTEIDSHISLPSISRSLNSLARNELMPFRMAIEAGVKMLMLGHLKVPSIDPAGIPVSISEKAVDYIRKRMNYKGILITDAINMGGLSKYSEHRASFMALQAGVDIVLHPLDTEKVVLYLQSKNRDFPAERLNTFRQCLFRFPDKIRPSFNRNSLLSDRLTRSAISAINDFRPARNISLLIISEEDKTKSKNFIKIIKAGIPGLHTVILTPGSSIPDIVLRDHSVITAVFSETRAWKGNTGLWLSKTISELEDETDLFISFGNPYLLRGIRRVPKMLVYWDSEPAQKIAAEELIKQIKIKSRSIP